MAVVCDSTVTVEVVVRASEEPQSLACLEDREYDLPYIFQTSQRERCSYQLCDKFADFKRHGIGITAWFGGLAGSSGREPY